MGSLLNAVQEISDAALCCVVRADANLSHTTRRQINLDKESSPTNSLCFMHKNHMQVLVRRLTPTICYNVHQTTIDIQSSKSQQNCGFACLKSCINTAQDNHHTRSST